MILYYINEEKKEELEYLSLFSVFLHHDTSLIHSRCLGHSNHFLLLYIKGEKEKRYDCVRFIIVQGIAQSYWYCIQHYQKARQCVMILIVQSTVLTIGTNLSNKQGAPIQVGGLLPGSQASPGSLCLRRLPVLAAGPNTLLRRTRVQKE